MSFMALVSRSSQILAIWLLTIFATPIFANEKLGNLSRWELKNDVATLTTDLNQTVTIKTMGVGIVRVTTARYPGAMTSETGMLSPSMPKTSSMNASENSAALFLSVAADLQIIVQKTPLRLEFWDPTRNLSYLKHSDGPVWSDKMLDQRFQAQTGERFAGLGHGFFGRVDSLDLSGRTIERNYGAAQFEQAPLIVPFYLSSRGYGIFVNSGRPNRFHFNDQGIYGFSLRDQDQVPVGDYFFLKGPALSAVLENYVALTGKPRLPQRSIFGLALSDKAEPQNNGVTWWQNKVAQHEN